MKPWFLFLLCYATGFQAQTIESVRTYFGDDFSQWVFYKKNEEIGTLKARWAFSSNFNEWDIRLGEFSGSVKLRWKNKPDEWEFRMGEHFSTIAPVWPGQYDAWRIEYKSKIYYLKLADDPDGLQWVLTNDDEELLFIYNEYLNDYRDWLLDSNIADLDLSLEIITAFIATYYSTPK